MEYNCALVTGGAGFIGSNLIEKLLEKDVETICVDNLLTGKRENIEEFETNDSFHFFKCDTLDEAKLSEIMKDFKPDIIFNQAASKKTICLSDPQRDLEINARGTLNLLQLSMKYGVERFIHASTGSVYGEAIIRPQDEGHPLNPTSYYGVSKLAGEKYVAAFNKLYGLDTSVLRYFHVYGPKQDFSPNGGVVAIFITRALEGQPLTIFGDGSQERSFTYVGDVVNANLFVAEDPSSSGEIYNCASGVNITIEGLTETIGDQLGMSPVVEYDDWAIGDIREFEIDNSKIRSIGFEFKTTFIEGIRETIDWYRNHLSSGN